LPPGSQLIGSAEIPEQTGPVANPTSRVETRIVVDTPSAPADVRQFYKATLTSQGWTVSQPFGPIFSGFIASALLGSEGDTYCESTAGPSLGIGITQRPGAANDLRLTLTTPSESCGVQNFPTSVPLPQNLLPALYPPDGITVVSGGSSSNGGQGDQASFAVAETNAGASELEQDYESQLVALGWTRIEAGNGQTLAWSSWSVPADRPRQALLTVWNGPGDSERQLEITVVTEGASTSGGPSSVIVGAPVPMPAPQSP